MGILDYLLRALGPEARSELAKEAAKRAVRGAGDAIYTKVDDARQEVEDSLRAKREAREREEAARERARVAEEAARERVRERARDAQQVEDELAALKARIRPKG